VVEQATEPEVIDPERLLTDRQYEVLVSLKRYIERRKYSPSVREIAEQFGWASTSTVAYHLDVLQEKGFIARDPFIARSIRLL
jgi:repressor LexA